MESSGSVGSSVQLSYLRDNCDYLTPNGTTDLLQALAFSVRNWFALQFVIGTALVAVVILLALIDSFFGNTPGTWSAFNHAAVWILGITVLLIAVLMHAYWLTQNKGRRASIAARNLPFYSLGIFCVAGAILVMQEYGFRPSLWRWNLPQQMLSRVGLAIIVFELLAVVVYQVVHSWVLRTGDHKRDSRENFERVRNLLTNAYTSNIGPLKMGLVQIAILMAIVAVVDAAGYGVSRLTERLLQEGALATQTGTILSVIAGFFGSNFTLAKLTKSLSLWSGNAADQPGSARVSRVLLFPAAVLGAILVTLLTTVFWAAVAHGIVNFAYSAASRYGDASCTSVWPYDPHCGHAQIALSGVLSIAVAIVVIDGWCIQFLNLSSYHRLYSVRLTRTFLGATNPERQACDRGRNVTALVPGDDIPMKAYFHPDSCAPVHIINSTINKTVDWDSSLVQRHTRGMPLGLGPAGMTIGQSFGILRYRLAEADDFTTPAAYTRQNGAYSVETLSLGDWVGISGAAVSTGLGQMTTPAYAMLLGAANVRLGYWWDSRAPSASLRNPDAVPVGQSAAAGTQATRARTSPWSSLFATQLNLCDELIARFEGPRGRRWYLTDGGHYENTGAYELIRRGLRNIIVLDNGCDPHDQFADIANLITHVRVDFGIDIVEAAVITPPALSTGGVGRIANSFAAFAQSPSCCGVQLTVLYPDGDCYGNLLVIKPRLVECTPYDLIEYQKQQPSFPQETTADQFFDPLQWEAHRALGYYIACEVFRHPSVPRMPALRAGNGTHPFLRSLKRPVYRVRLERG